ncbi:hypothetical protein TNCV_613451 [Trichonephila clavipes]|nr:hypothetical protein TNCV_613451 [Trichonephila clavipes]
MSEGRFDLSTFRSERTNEASTLTIPPKRSSSRDVGHLSKSRPNYSRGPRCLSCNLYGHKSFECRRANLNNTSTPPSGINAVHELPSPINVFKDVTIIGRKLKGQFQPFVFRDSKEAAVTRLKAVR